MTTIRLLSYNIRSLRDDPAAVVRVIRRLRPDVACVQEAPRLAFWRGRRRWIANRTGLTLATGRRATGLAVLVAPSSVDVVHRECRSLTPVPGLHRRGLALCVLDVGGVRLVVASVHLDLHAGPRLRHAREVADDLGRVGEKHSAPVVLAGDVNEEPGGPTWEFLTGLFQDAYAVAPRGEALTFSARRPRARIDGVFTGPSVTVLGCGVPDDAESLADYPAASDHRPLLAELRVGR